MSKNFIVAKDYKWLCTNCFTTFCICIEHKTCVDQALIDYFPYKSI